jgi:hypothetical protein
MNTNPRCVIKASLENSEEVRRFALETKELSNLYSILSELFLLNENFSIRYKDDQGDIILISNDIELAEAIIVSNNLLRIFVRKEGVKMLPLKEESSSGSSSAELIAPRDVIEVKKLLPEVAVFAAQNAPEKLLIPSYNPSIADVKVAETSDKLANTPAVGNAPDTLADKLAKKPAEKPADLLAVPTDSALVGPFLKVRQTREQFIKAKQDMLASKDRVCTLKKQLEAEMKDIKKLKEDKAKKLELEKDAPKKIMGRFVKHVTVPDNTELPPNTPFVKTWRFRNETDKPWPAKAQLIFVGKSEEDRLAEVKSLDVGTLAPGQEKDISISMKTPAKQGHYISYWRLCNPVTDKKFGQRVWVMINVVCDSSSSSSGDEKDEQEVAKKYGAALRQLHEMGFTDYKRNVKYLLKTNGDLAQTVKKLVKKMGKK